MDAIARRYNTFLFNDELMKSWKSPYRRAVLAAALDIETEERVLMKFHTQHFPEFIKNMTNALGTSNVNALINIFCKKGKPIKSIFKKQRRRTEFTGVDDGLGVGTIITQPDGTRVKIMGG